MSRTDRWVLSLPAVLLVTALLLLSGPLLENSSSAEAPQSGATVEQMMAGLSDEQVRQLLIDELKKEALPADAASQQMKGPAFFLDRLLKLLSSGQEDSRNEVKALFSFLPTVGPDLYRVFVKL